MKYGKSRVCGFILTLLAAAILCVACLSQIADRSGTPLSGAYRDAVDFRTRRSDLKSAIANAEDGLARARKRAEEVIAGANDCISQAEDALEAEANGTYDEETDAGLLGKSIVDAQNGGADLDAVVQNLAPVVNADLVALLDETKTGAKRAENAVEEAVEALEQVVSAAQAVDESAAFDAIPTVEALEVPKLGDLAGATRLLTRANNYLARGEAALANCDTLDEASPAILDPARNTVNSAKDSLKDRLLLFANSRYVDLYVYGGILLVIGLMLLIKPAYLARKWKNSLFRKGTVFVVCVSLLAAALHYAPGSTWELMRKNTLDTLYMTVPATLFAYLVGLPLGILLVVTTPGHICPNPTVNSVVGTVVNFLRSIPFIILLVLLFDVTRVVTGAAIGTKAVVFPLFVSAFPYVARIVEGSINEVDRGVIEAAQSMGSTTWQIIRKVLIPESLPSLINGAAICTTTILAYTAMAGSAGGDGLGKVAIVYGLNYHDYEIMYIASLLLVALVQVIQIAGGILTRAVDHRKR